MHDALFSVAGRMEYDGIDEYPGYTSDDSKDVSPGELVIAENDEDDQPESPMNEEEEGEVDEPSNDASFGSSNDDNGTEPSPFEEIKENIYLVDRKKSRTSKEARRMKCDCVFEPEDPYFVGCGDSCLNRLLMIECTSRCRCGEFCTNKNFQRGTKFKLEVFKTAKKGFGLRTLENIPRGSFVIEYCGEIVDYTEFLNRTELYEAEGRKHYYFMTLKTNEVIDATKKGAISRFINHSCDPNCETQKWTVYGFLRIGFFSVRDISAGEELSFDYQFERYGEKAQKCYCGASCCRGIIGGEKQARLKASFYDRAPSRKKGRRKREEEAEEEEEEEEEEEDDDALDDALESEVTELLGSEGRICEAEQVLELTRLMVKVEKLSHRQRLLKVLQGCTDPMALKHFVRYNGLSLLWSWMIDATDESAEYKIEILNTLRHVPIPNMNQLKDSKILQVVQKWASCSGNSVKASPDGEEEVSSNSDAENEGKNGSDSSSQNGEAIEEGAPEQEASPDETGSKDSDDAKEEDRKDMSEKPELQSGNNVVTFASGLLETWKSLKEIFKIPKKSQMTPDKRSKNGSDVESYSSPNDEKRATRKKWELKGEERNSKNSPLAETGAAFDTSPAAVGGMSPVLPFLSPVRAPQSKALANHQPMQKHGDDSETTRISDEKENVEGPGRENGRESQLSNPGDDNGDYSELWDDLFVNREPEFPDGDTAHLVMEDAELERKEDLGTRRWSRWQKPDGDNRRGSHFGGGKNQRKRRRRGSFGWEQGRYQYPGRAGRGGGRERSGRVKGDGGYERGVYGSDYDGQYSSHRRVEGDTDHGYRREQNPRDHADFAIRSSSSEGCGAHFLGRNFLDTPSSHMSGGTVTPRMNLPVPCPPGGLDLPSPGRFPVSSANQLPDLRPIEVIGQPRSMWQGAQSSGSTTQAVRLPPPQIRPPFPTQPPPIQQTFAQMPTSVNSAVPRPPVMQHPVPPPPAQLPQPANTALGNFGRYGIASPVTPSVSTAPMLPIPPVVRPPLECPTQPPPPNQPPFAVQPNLRFPSTVGGAQHLPPSPAPIPNPPRIAIPAPPPALLTGRLPIPMPQLPSPMPLRPQAGDPLVTSSMSLPQGPAVPSLADVSKHLHSLTSLTKTVTSRPTVEMPRLNTALSPVTQTETPISSSSKFRSPVNDLQFECSPVSSKPIPPLPQNWKTATDPEGKIYYYHTITRQTQWDPPSFTDEDVGRPHPDDTSFPVGGPRTPSLSPPHSPVTPSDRAGSVMAAADTTVNRHKPSTAQQSHRLSTEHLSPKSQKARDSFKTKLSAVVVNCLNPYQKVDCKQGKITCTDDFKFLARKLTHGLMVKEIARVKTEGNLECNDSVKIKVKEYIRNYMKKFGDFYFRS